VASARDERSNPFVWFAAVAVGLIAVTLVAIAVVVLNSGGDDTPMAALPPPTLAEDTTIRARPTESASEVVRAAAGTRVEVRGRLESGGWLLVSIDGRLGSEGWVPRSAVRDAPSDDALRTVSLPNEPRAAVPSPSAGPPRTQPNLVFEAVDVRDNQLVAILGNDGRTNITAAVTVTVDGGEPYRVDVTALRPGARIEVPLRGEFVQRRATVTANAVATGLAEETLEDNRITATVEPDAPNDLEVLAALLNPELAVTIRNNSPIPIVGTITIVVRDTSPENTLVARLADASLEIGAAGSVQVFRFPASTRVDLEKVRVLIQTSAINDSNIANDVFPR
jgi:hypothetical protein